MKVPIVSAATGPMHSLSALPQKPDAVIIEVPGEEARDWLARAAAAGVSDVWNPHGL